MIDAKYINSCDHHIVCDVLDIERVDNSNLYKATLKYPAITNNNLTFIRNYNDEKNFLYSNTSYKDVFSYSYTTVNGTFEELPKSKLNSFIGITNFRFESPTTIIFGEDEDDQTINRIISLDDVVPKPIYLIDYYCKSETCPKCRGTGIVQDMVFDGTGGVKFSEGTQKLIQTVIKILITPVGDSPEDIQYGSSLDSLIGSTIDITTTASIQKCIYDAIDYVIRLQSGEDMTPEETVTGVSNISIDEDKLRPGVINITVVVIDGNGTEVPCVVSLGVN